jgi:hypothetical protein
MEQCYKFPQQYYKFSRAPLANFRVSPPAHTSAEFVGKSNIWKSQKKKHQQPRRAAPHSAVGEAAAGVAMYSMFRDV